MAAPLKVDITNDRGTGELTYVFETDRAFPVPENEGKSHLVRNRCRYVLPRDWRREDTHPDLLALAGITAIAPYAPEEIEFSMPVSSCFHQSCLDFLGKRVGPVDHTLKRREPPPYSIIGLSYSGGVDSTAALQLLPEETVSFFLNRMNESARRTLYSGEAALQACDELRENGRVVYIVDSDMEHLRNPVGFPVDIACANPAILMADRECLDAVAFGTILESAYRIGYGGFQDYARRDHFLKWGGLFRTVGLPFCQVTAGVSEVGTSKLVLWSPFHHVARPCERGTRDRPCFNCFKCFRKMLIDRTLRGEVLSDSWLDQAFTIREARHALVQVPVKSECVVAYITRRYSGKHGLMNALKEKVRGYMETDWLERWYGRSIDLIPEKYRRTVRKNILTWLDEMGPEDVSCLTSWDPEILKQDEIYMEKNRRFENLLKGR